MDLPLLAGERLTLADFSQWSRKRWPGLALLVRLPQRTFVSGAEEAWATANGAAALLAGQSASAARDSVGPAIGKVLKVIGSDRFDPERLATFLRVLRGAVETPQAARIARTHALDDLLVRTGIRLDDMYREMLEHGGVPVQDRTYRGRKFRQCFVGSDAFAFMRSRGRLDGDSANAAAEAMARRGMLHHVLREHELRDATYFFRFDGTDAVLDAIDLDETVCAMRGPKGVSIATRTYFGKPYERCFLGSDAADWLVSRYRLTIGSAEAIGQRLVDLGAIRHVVDEHGFVDAPYFYRFMADETRQ